jgi:hypothetical protein
MAQLACASQEIRWRLQGYEVALGLSGKEARRSPSKKTAASFSLTAEC